MVELLLCVTFREASKKHVEFAGRRNLGEVAKLYIKMEKENMEEAGSGVNILHKFMKLFQNGLFKMIKLFPKKARKNETNFQRIFCRILGPDC